MKKSKPCRVGSFALWYEKKEKEKEELGKEEELTAVLNFNLWTQCHWKNDISFFDVGFDITNMQLSQKILFYIPFKVSEDKIYDLSGKISSAEITDVIFNEDYSVKDIPQTGYKEVYTEDDNLKFVISELDKKRNFEIENKYSGTVVIIKTEEIYNIYNQTANKDSNERNNHFYFRFRIICDKATDFIHEFKPKGWSFQSFISDIFTVDFRYNSRRNLNHDLRIDLLTKKAKNQNVEFIQYEKLHFFLMTKADADIDDSAKPRMLEQDIWDNYVNNNDANDNDTNDIVAYHISDKPISDKPKQVKDSWEYFTKIHIYKSKVWIYIIVTLLISIVGGVGGSMVVGVGGKLIDKLGKILWHILSRT